VVSQIFPALRRKTISGLWFALKSTLEKKKIIWQDQQGRYTYGRWIRTVEPVLLKRALEAKGSQGAAAPSVCFFHFEKDFTNQSPAQMAAWMERQSADWVIPIQAGDQLSPEWPDLFRQSLVRNPDADLVYWDEDILTDAGQRDQPFFKPDWSPELLFSINYLECAAYRKNLLCEYLRSRQTVPDGWFFDLTGMARNVMHIPFVLQHRKAATQSTPRDRAEQHARVVKAYLERYGFRNVTVTVEPDEPVLRARWDGAGNLVSIIIPTKNNLHYLQRCLSSLFDKTSGVDYEVLLMDDHSSDPQVHAYYQELQQSHKNIRVYENEGSFNYSRVNNRGATLANGELLLFLNNDVEILSSDWLAEMVRWTQLSGVGMVGAKLIYPDRAIQHAGIVVGMTGHGAHLFAGQPPKGNRLFFSPERYRNVSAVTGACMLVRRDIFEQIGGFNEDFLLVFNDIEIGLRVLRSGYRVVYTPAAELIHYEGRSRARYIPPPDIRLATELLGDYVRQGDPYYNPNLSYAVNWPTLRRLDEQDPWLRLKQITRFKG
jgi:O-antigen biosynthesis protein